MGDFSNRRVSFPSLRNTPSCSRSQGNDASSTQARGIPSLVPIGLVDLKKAVGYADVAVVGHELEPHSKWYGMVRFKEVRSD